MSTDDHIKRVHSPESDYTIDFYRWDQGATGTFGARGERERNVNFGLKRMLVVKKYV
ncbi:DUF5412 domain-containing protein [Alkalihalobacillus wakoensis]|uniref:DUF5412 domain-containing protein n=1 Tax=Halalkalibacter wakoensis TaxID=127891 RepID=UPI00138F1E3B